MVKKVRECKLCHDTGMLLVWKRDPLTGRLIHVEEVCACMK